MFSKTKLKKWHLITILVLGFGGYWLLSNVMLFHMPISVEEYEQFLTESKWKSERRNSIWNFRENGTFYLSSLESNETFEQGTWELDSNYLITRTDSFEYSKWKILRAFENEMDIKLIVPSPGGKYVIQLLKLN